VSKKQFEPGEIREILLRLSEEIPNLILVGGQAVNFWSARYYQDNEQWDTLRPFTSEDIDFLGSKQDVQNISTFLGGEIFINDSFDASPNAGVVLVKHQGEQLRIDVLATLFGLDEQAVIDNPYEFIGERELEGVKLKVIDPVSALEGKLACLFGLPQEGRQDLKHTRLCVKVLNAFLKEHLPVLPDKVVLGVVEHVFKMAVEKNGLSAWLQHGIEIEQGIPLDVLEVSEVEKIQRFNKIRKPQLIEHLQSKRQEHRAKLEKRGGSSAFPGL
jgi:hypothetical protein